MKRVYLISLFISALLILCAGCGIKTQSNSPETESENSFFVSHYSVETETVVITTEPVSETEKLRQDQSQELIPDSDKKEYSEQTITNIFEADETSVPVETTIQMQATDIDYPLIENSETEEIKEIALQTEATETTSGIEPPPVYDKPNVITNTYSYKKLPEESKVIYSKILSAMKMHETNIDFSKPIDLDKLMDIYSLIYSDEINMQYIGSSFKYDSNPVTSMKITYKYSPDFVENMNAKTEEAAMSIISQITPDMTEYDIVKMFHDEIISRCSYDASAKFSNMAYGVFVEGKASCQGYAHAMSYLCNKVGIENTFLTGFAGEPHMWNMINLEGNWYNIDLTGDDVETNIPGFISYNYFNVTDEELTDRQYYDSIVKKPQATSVEHNFFVYNGYLVSSKEAATQVIYNQYVDALQNKKNFIYLKCSDKKTYDEIYKYLFNEHNIFAIQLLAIENTGIENEQNKLQLVKNDLLYTFQIIIQ